jgi:hypothetical protein
LSIDRTSARIVPAVAWITVIASWGTGSAEPLTRQASAASSAGPFTSDSGAARTAARARACTPDEVGVSFGDRAGGATGERSLAVRFTNHGPRSCILAARPRVEFLDSEGNPVGLREDENGPGRQYVAGVSTGPFRLRPGASADVVIGKYRCDLGNNTVATEVRIGLPAGGRATTLIINRDSEIGVIASCLGGRKDPGQSFAISGYRTFHCHLVGNAIGAGWCQGEVGNNRTDPRTSRGGRQEAGRRQRAPAGQDRPPSELIRRQGSGVVHQAGWSQ